jgi:hypothetical protein
MAGQTVVIVAVGIPLPFSPLATILGFTRLPGTYFTFLVTSTVTYLFLVEVAKQQLVSRLTSLPGLRLQTGGLIGISWREFLRYSPERVPTRLRSPFLNFDLWEPLNRLTEFAQS